MNTETHWHAKSDLSSTFCSGWKSSASTFLGNATCSARSKPGVYNGSQMGLGCHCFMIIFLSFVCILLFPLCLHLPSSVLLLMVLPCDFSNASPPLPLLCLFAVALRWREGKLASDHRWPAAHSHEKVGHVCRAPRPVSRELKIPCSIHLERVSPAHILAVTQSIYKQ